MLLPNHLKNGANTKQYRISLRNDTKSKRQTYSKGTMVDRSGSLPHREQPRDIESTWIFFLMRWSTVEIFNAVTTAKPSTRGGATPN